MGSLMIGKLGQPGAAENPSFEVVWVLYRRRPLIFVYL